MKKDIVIIGAGPAGLSFASSLANSGLNVLVVESLSEAEIAEPAYDGRDIALTHFSQKLMQQMGIWDLIPEAEIFPIKEAKVLDGDSPYTLKFDSEDIAESFLGFNVSNHLIRKAVYEKASTLPNVELLTDTSVSAVQKNTGSATVSLANGKSIETKLLVAADSRFSETRRKMGISANMHDFGRVCIVSRMQHQREHHGIAHECFFYGETLAVLPLSSHESSIVITVSSSKAERIMAMSVDEFNQHVESQYSSKLGEMTLCGKRHPYPLVAVWANHFASERFALIGDAAVGMHPVTAHGFNLGLRSQHTLATLIKEAGMTGADIGSSELLQAYETKHRRVARPIYMGTNAIVKIFTNDKPLHRLARKALLRFGNIFPPVKRKITQQLTESNS